MICNVAQWDRFIRFLISVGMLAYAIAGGPTWFYVAGLYLLLTAGWCLCPIYAYLKIRTY